MSANEQTRLRLRKATTITHWQTKGGQSKGETGNKKTLD